MLAVPGFKGSLSRFIFFFSAELNWFFNGNIEACLVAEFQVILNFTMAVRNVY